jgi:hypothetical protein
MMKDVLKGVAWGVVLFVGLVGMMAAARGVFSQVPTRERVLEAYNAAGGPLVPPPPPQVTAVPSPGTGLYWSRFELLDGSVVSGEVLKAAMEYHAEKGDLDEWLDAYVKTAPARGGSYVFRAYPPNGLLGFSHENPMADILLLGCFQQLPEGQAIAWRGEVSSAACVNRNCQIVVAYFGE